MSSSKQIVWPYYIRIIHWIIALTVVLNIFILEEGDPPHRNLGYLALGLVLVRFFLGFINKKKNLFPALPLKWSDIKTHATSHFNGPPVDYEGHTPLASVVYVLIWICLIGLAISGWMLGLDAFWGDETLEEIHGAISTGLEVLVVIHFIGIALDSYFWKRKTWMSMIKGYK